MKNITTSFIEFLNENSNDEVKKIKTKIDVLTTKQREIPFSPEISYDKKIMLEKEWDNIQREIDFLRRDLYNLTGDAFGNDTNKVKKLVKPMGLNKQYNHPNEVPKAVYRWILNNDSLLYSDASDAVRWSRIVNSSDEPRYRGDITIYRAVNNNEYDDIREGDWVTTEERYAILHNNKYFNGNGKIISMDVNGRDVLKSPTGDVEEAIYAPLKYSIDIKL